MVTAVTWWTGPHLRRYGHGIYEIWREREGSPGSAEEEAPAREARRVASYVNGGTEGAANPARMLPGATPTFLFTLQGKVEYLARDRTKEHNARVNVSHQNKNGRPHSD